MLPVGTYGDGFSEGHITGVPLTFCILTYAAIASMILFDVLAHAVAGTKRETS